MTTLGISGAGHIGSQVARLAIARDDDVVIAQVRQLVTVRTGGGTARA